MARPGYALGTAAAGDVANKAMASGKGNYLANLVLYPGEAAVVAVAVGRRQWLSACINLVFKPCWGLQRAVSRLLHSSALLVSVQMSMDDVTGDCLVSL